MDAQIPCMNIGSIVIMTLLMFKKVRTIFVYAFITQFAFIAIIGEGLHFLPGMGHSDECSCCSHSDTNHDCSATSHALVISQEVQNSHDLHKAADCPICQYFAQVKPLILAFNVETDYLVVIERIEVASSFLLSRCETAYQSRAPPSCPSMA
jgi:hypothetical protein